MVFDSWDLPQIFLVDSFIKKMKRFRNVSTMPYAIQNEDSQDVTCGWYCISFINSELPLYEFAKLFIEDVPGKFPDIEKHNIFTMKSFLRKPVIQEPSPQQEDWLNATFHPFKREHIAPKNSEEITRRFTQSQET